MEKLQIFGQILVGKSCLVFWAPDWQRPALLLHSLTWAAGGMLLMFQMFTKLNSTFTYLRNQFPFASVCSAVKSKNVLDTFQLFLLCRRRLSYAVETCDVYFPTNIASPVSIQRTRSENIPFFSFVVLIYWWTFFQTHITGFWCHSSKEKLNCKESKWKTSVQLRNCILRTQNIHFQSDKSRCI